MKKILITTTALTMVASAALAKGPTVTVGGFLDFQIGNRSQESKYEGTNQRDTVTQTNTEIHINVDAEADNGLKYGAAIALEADVNADDRTGGGNANNNAASGYLYVESDFGRVEAGATGGVARALQVDASNIARGTGGIRGDFIDYVDVTREDLIEEGVEGNGVDVESVSGYDSDALFQTSSSIGLAGALGNDDTRLENDADTFNKINYLSPKFAGAQIGVSYAPSSDQRGSSGTGFSGDSDPLEFEDIWELALKYSADYNQVGIEASIGGQFADSENDGANRDDLKSYSLGLSANFAGVTVAGSYLKNDELGALSDLNVSSDAFTLGAAYEFGPFATSITYLNSEVKNGAAATLLLADPNNPLDPRTEVERTGDAEFSNLSIGVDYQLAPGLVPYVEVSFFDSDDNIALTDDNEGTVFIAGTTLNF
jgi:hypothetical protein